MNANDKMETVSLKDFQICNPNNEQNKTLVICTSEQQFMCPKYKRINSQEDSMIRNKTTMQYIKVNADKICEFHETAKQKPSLQKSRSQGTFLNQTFFIERQISQDMKEYRKSSDRKIMQNELTQKQKKNQQKQENEQQMQQLIANNQYLLKQLEIHSPQKFNHLMKHGVYLQIDYFMNKRDSLPTQLIFYSKIQLPDQMVNRMELQLKNDDMLVFPIVMKEPISYLQRECEYFQNCYLLEKADQEISWQMKAVYIQAFIIASLDIATQRLKVPFEPLIEETYYFKDEIFEFQGECVGPNKVVYECSNEVFQYNACVEYKMQKLGKHVQMQQQGIHNVILKSSNLQFYFTRPDILMQNFKEDYSLQVNGEIFLKEVTNDLVSKVQFNTSNSNFKGTVYQNKITSNQNNKYSIYGDYNKCMMVSKIKDSKFDYLSNQDNQNDKIVWMSTQKSIENGNNYMFSELTLQLNHLNQELLFELPITDSRFRIEMRYLEFQDIEKSSQSYIEELNKQRIVQKSFRKQKLEYKSKLFVKQKINNIGVYILNSHYQ